jgi:RNA polymerase sigma factor (sigma-70 family)
MPSDAAPLRTGMSRTPQNLEEVYRSWTPLLLSALRRLRASGYTVDALDGMDLVHDFYLEVVPDLLERYEPERAQFSTYLYGAFLRFARPRIIRELRWKGMLTDLEELPQGWKLATWPEFVDAAESSDADALSEAIGQQFALLPSSLRVVVNARIVEGLSERDAARRLKITRYAVRQRTAEALGRLAVGIGEDHRITGEFRPLAVRVWRDGRSLMEAAAELGLSRAKARAAYRRLLASVVVASAPTRARDAHETEAMAIDICEIWARVTANPSDPDALAAARTHLPLLLEHVSDCETCSETAVPTGDLDDLLDALSDGAERLSEEERRTVDALHEAWDSNERDIETAMSELLLSALPEPYNDLKSLGTDVTLLSAFLALSAIDHLVYRHLMSSGSEGVELTREGGFIQGSLAIPRRELVEEMARHAGVPTASAETLFDWARHVTRYVPRVFLHFVAIETLEDNVRLSLSEPTLQHNLGERWAPVSRVIDDEFEPLPADVAVVLRQIQAAAETLGPQLKAAAVAAVQDDIREGLLQQAERNQEEVAAIKEALESARVEDTVVEVAQAAAAAARAKQVLYEKVGNSSRNIDLCRPAIRQVIERGRSDSQSRVKEADEVVKKVAAASG